MKLLYTRIQNFLTTHERLLLPTFLIIGFIIDSFTLTRIDQLFDNIILIMYLILSGGSIILIYSGKKLFKNNSLGVKLQTFLPYILQYAFGGLFSGLFIFYSKSSAFITSFPFLITLLFILIGNEFFHRKKQRIHFWLTLYAVALISYSILIIPVVMRTLSVWGVILGLCVGLGILFGFVFLMTKIVPEYKKEENVFHKIIITIAIIFSLLYITNIIPPVPLSLKEIGVFHSVIRTDEGYVTQGEQARWFEPFRKSSRMYNRYGNGPVYIFSSVFAPSKIQGTIYHHWSYYDTNQGWISTSRIPINITGGREKGFRGYSLKSSVFPASWRVDIENEKGQIAGRVRFEIKESASQPPLSRSVF